MLLTRIVLNLEIAIQILVTNRICWVDIYITNHKSNYDCPPCEEHSSYTFVYKWVLWYHTMMYQSTNILVTHIWCANKSWVKYWWEVKTTKQVYLKRTTKSSRYILRKPLRHCNHNLWVETDIFSIVFSNSSSPY